MSLVAPFSYGQKSVVANPKQTIIYCGVENPLIVLVEGLRCGEFNVSTNNGIIHSSSTSCSFQIFPNKLGTATIFIHSTDHASRLIDSTTIRVHDIPAPVIVIAGKSGGEIGKRMLKAQLGVAAILANSDFDVKFDVVSFTLTIMRVNKLLFTAQNLGPRFSSAIRDAFDELDTDDRLLITNAVSLSPDGRRQLLQPVEFRIVRD